ncbi:hypothetical protein EYR41_008555 [Orbilia oligospora]|uniref:Uncharacterized protein n=1 Tax=Orbilia oligospora TaxID=2813651 RepID=A0A7C8PA81_ORBOL|nr:hypothetical protein TWF751_009128 [Orbilia oligospora]TGJ66969.1 hypothetical protein EYR41_008555 [Orbilia oligospora]
MVLLMIFLQPELSAAAPSNRALKLSEGVSLPEDSVFSGSISPVNDRLCRIGLYYLGILPLPFNQEYYDKSDQKMDIGYATEAYPIGNTYKEFTTVSAKNETKVEPTGDSWVFQTENRVEFNETEAVCTQIARDLDSYWEFISIDTMRLGGYCGCVFWDELDCSGNSFQQLPAMGRKGDGNGIIKSGFGVLEGIQTISTATIKSGKCVPWVPWQKDVGDSSSFVSRCELLFGNGVRTQPPQPYDKGERKERKSIFAFENIDQITGKSACITIPDEEAFVMRDWEIKGCTCSFFTNDSCEATAILIDGHTGHRGLIEESKDSGAKLAMKNKNKSQILRSNPSVTTTLLLCSTFFLPLQINPTAAVAVYNYPTFQQYVPPELYKDGYLQQTKFESPEYPTLSRQCHLGLYYFQSEDQQIWSNYNEPIVAWEGVVIREGYDDKSVRSWVEDEDSATNTVTACYNVKNNIDPFLVDKIDAYYLSGWCGCSFYMTEDCTRPPDRDWENQNYVETINYNSPKLYEYERYHSWRSNSAILFKKVKRKVKSFSFFQSLPSIKTEGVRGETISCKITLGNGSDQRPAYNEIDKANGADLVISREYSYNFHVFPIMTRLRIGMGLPSGAGRSKAVHANSSLMTSVRVIHLLGMGLASM